MRKGYKLEGKKNAFIHRNIPALRNLFHTSSAAMITSSPVLSPPSTRSRDDSRKPFSTKVRWASARPSSQLEPACLIEDRGLEIEECRTGRREATSTNETRHEHSN